MAVRSQLGQTLKAVLISRVQLADQFVNFVLEASLCSYFALWLYLPILTTSVLIFLAETSDRSVFDAFFSRYLLQRSSASTYHSVLALCPIHQAHGNNLLPSETAIRRSIYYLSTGEFRSKCPGPWFPSDNSMTVLVVQTFRAPRPGSPLSSIKILERSCYTMALPFCRIGLLRF